MENKKMSSHPHYIVIGLHKCGTMSLTKLFRSLGIPSCHAHVDDSDGESKPVGYLIEENRKHNKPLLGGVLESYHAFLEIDSPRRNEWAQITLIDELTTQYPNAYYILNTRNVEDHATSMWNWTNLKDVLNFYDVPNLVKHTPENGLTRFDLEVWIRNHNQNMRTFFAHRPHLKMLEIEMGAPDTARRLGDFIGLPISEFPHINKSSSFTTKPLPLDMPLMEQIRNAQREARSRSPSSS